MTTKTEIQATQVTRPPQDVQQAIQQQAGRLLAQVAGYVGVRTMAIGLRLGLYEEIARTSGGLTADALAARKGMDPFYTAVWCRSAYASDTLEYTENGRYVLAPHVDTLLLNGDFPGYMGAMPMVLTQPEVFDRFTERLPTGKRMWWNECSPDWIDAVSGTGRGFYNRLIPNGLAKVPGLQQKLEHGAVLELACGAGLGLVKTVKTYPNAVLTGLDGDAYSLEVAARRLREAGLEKRVRLIHSSLEDLKASDEYDVAINNISMHECRDIERATANVHRALKLDGYFVISDFPFPEKLEETRSVPARIMSGIQFFEALIGDQLLSPQYYQELLTRHRFRSVGVASLTPMHTLVYGQK